MRLDILTLILLAAAVGSTPTRPALAQQYTSPDVQRFLQSLPPEHQPSSGMRHESSPRVGGSSDRYSQPTHRSPGAPTYSDSERGTSANPGHQQYYGPNGKR